MEQFYTVPVGNEQYVVIAIDLEARTARWVKPEPGKSLYKSRQAAAWHRKHLETEDAMTITLSSYVGHEGAFWERVSLVFEGLGYEAPTPDTENGGGYVLNIVNQYLANFSQEEVLQVIEYAQSNTLANLQHSKNQGWIDREAVFGERSL